MRKAVRLASGNLAGLPEKFPITAIKNGTAPEDSVSGSGDVPMCTSVNDLRILIYRRRFRRTATTIQQPRVMQEKEKPGNSYRVPGSVPQVLQSGFKQPQIIP